jgi:hypothetical protein
MLVAALNVFCGEWCAGSCLMFSMKAGVDTSPEAAIERLSERHLQNGDGKDLKRIEKILDKLVTDTWLSGER